MLETKHLFSQYCMQEHCTIISENLQYTVVILVLQYL